MLLLNVLVSGPLCKIVKLGRPSLRQPLTRKCAIYERYSDPG